MVNTKKLIVAMSLLVLSISATFADEARDAAQALREKNIISQNPDKVAYEQPIQRREAAVVMKRYAVSEWKAMTQSCSLWGDTTTLSEKNELLESCKVWLFKQASKFYPYQNFTRGQLIMVLARFLNNNPTMELDASYDDLLARRVITVDDRALSTRNAMRSEVYLMLYRLKNPPSAVFQQVLKLYAYETDSVFGTIEYNWYGSAVLVAKNKILTNAHVVLDEDGNPLKHFEYCVSQSSTVKPVCGTAAKLLYYDQEIDLALLELEKDLSIAPVQLSTTSQLAIWDKITVYGYPANGGGTVTMTQGVIGGFSEPFYKIDANLDGWNSGGWGFDSAGKLVGIPTFVSEWYTTLGYIVPINKVRDFLAKRGNIKEVSHQVNTQFKEYITKVASAVKQNAFSHDEWQGKVPQWFQINDIMMNYTETVANAYPQVYYIFSKNKKTSINFGITTVNADRDSAKVLEAVVEKAKKNYLEVYTWEFSTGWTAWYIVTIKSSNQDKKFVGMYYFEKNPKKTILYVNVAGSTDYPADLANAKKLVESVVRTKVLPVDIQANKVLWPVTIDNFQWFSSELVFTDSLGLNITVDKATKGQIGIEDVSYWAEQVNYSLQDYFNKVEEGVKSYYEEGDIEMKLVKNSKWTIWIFMKTKEWSDGTMGYSFITLSRAPDTSKWRVISVSFEWSETNESKIINFMDGISVNGTLPFSSLNMTPSSLK